MSKNNRLIVKEKLEENVKVAKNRMSQLMNEGTDEDYEEYG